MDVVNSGGKYVPEDTGVITEDLSILPLGKDSFAVCEFCGFVGDRRQFYFRNNKYCSLRCNLSIVRKRNCNWKFKTMGGTEHLEGMIPLEPTPQLQLWPKTLSDLQTNTTKHSAHIAEGYQWKDELFGCDFLAAPVSLFKHAPLNDMWDHTFEGMKVEVINTDLEECADKSPDYFWVATVLKVKGYMGLLRYEGFGTDDSKDFWVNLCCSEVHPVGWCAMRGKPLIPPRSIEDKYSDWKKFLVKQLTGARTLPANFYSKLTDNLKSRFSVGTVMEVVDKERISQVKVASVYEIIGKRLHIKYFDSSPEDHGFWFHEDSPLIHPVGWAFRVGHLLDAPTSYCDRVAAGRYHANDSTPDMFYEFPNEPPLFTQGMKLEAIDPLNLSSVCAATVMQILADGYMMIRIDSYTDNMTRADWFCYHQRSACIFPVGFCLANNVPLVPPHEYKDNRTEFSWQDHLSATGAPAAGPESFAARSHGVEHGFVTGMRLECVDLMDPRLICVATVARVVGDLLKVHFDGWGDEYDQWLWAHSTDMYPVGWCRAVGHKLEGPMQPPPAPVRPVKKTKPKTTKRKKKAPRNGQQRQPSEEKNSKVITNKLSPPVSGPETPADVHMPLADVEMPLADVDIPLENVDMPLANVDMPLAENGINDETPETPTMEVDNTHTEEPVSRLEVPVQEVVTEHKKEVVTEYKKEVVTEHKSNSVPTNGTTNQSEVVTVDHNTKLIPRLVNTIVPLSVFNSIDPENWTTSDVGKFLTVNECQPYCVSRFSSVTGSMLLKLSKDEIIELLEKKVGPSLKILDLIQQLKCKMKQPSRLLCNFK